MSKIYYGKDLLKNAGIVADPECISDGSHTFKDLYNQRLHLSAALVNAYPDLCYKSRLDSEGKPWFDGNWFLVGFHTPDGEYSYHYENKYWDMFACPILDRAPEWDGHTSKDVDRLDSMIETRVDLY